MRLPSGLAVVLVCACNASPTSSSRVIDEAPIREMALRVNAHVIILKSQSMFAEYRGVLHIVRDIDGVVAAAPFIFTEALVASADRAPIEFALKGVDPQRFNSVIDINARMKVGKLDDLAPGEPPAIILGDLLAATLQVRTGDHVVVSVQPGVWPLENQPPAVYSFRVTGILHTGLDVYDRRLALTSLEATQEILGLGDQVMGVEVKVKDVHRAGDVARAIEHALGGPYDVEDWRELNRDLFETRLGL